MEQRLFDVKVRCQVEAAPKEPERLSIGTVMTFGVWALVLIIFIVCMTVDVCRRHESSKETSTEPSTEEVTTPVNDSATELWVAETEKGPVAADTPEAVVAKLIAEAQVVDRPANPWGVPLMDDELEAVYETCQEWHFSEELALALIWEESRFDREAVNVDCYGLCQLKERYFPGAKDMTGAENIRAGLTYLGKLLEKYDSLDAALTAYRWGHDTGDREYATEVIGRLMYYGGMFGE